MWIQLTLLVLGFVALIWSADKFLSGAAATATNMGVSKMMIGLTVVSVGTSAPEIVVASMAARAAAISETPPSVPLVHDEQWHASMLRRSLPIDGR